MCPSPTVSSAQRPPSARLLRRSPATQAGRGRSAAGALSHASQKGPHMTTNEELIGRADLDDLGSILSITNRDVDVMVHAVRDNADAIFTWDYEKGARPAL